MMKPFSDNLVFVDTEFTDLRAGAQLLSIGLVKLTGEELYVEIETDAPCSSFVIEHVLPHMTGEAMSAEEAERQIRAFLGDAKPYMVGGVSHYDFVFLIEFFGVDNMPIHWHSIDFASILFGSDIDPELYRRSNGHQLARSLGIDPEQYQLHRAIDDARFLRDVWMKYYDIGS